MNILIVDHIKFFQDSNFQQRNLDALVVDSCANLMDKIMKRKQNYYGIKKK